MEKISIITFSMLVIVVGWGIAILTRQYYITKLKYRSLDITKLPIKVGDLRDRKNTSPKSSRFNKRILIQITDLQFDSKIKIWCVTYRYIFNQTLFYDSSFDKLGQNTLDLEFFLDLYSNSVDKDNINWNNYQT